LARPKNAKKRSRARAPGVGDPKRSVAERGSTTSGSSRPASKGSTTSGSSRRTSQEAKRGNAAEEGRVRYREVGGTDRRRTLLYIAILVCSVIVAVTVIAPLRGPIAAALLVLVTLWMLVAWHNKGYAYRCANCRRVFQVPTFVNFLTFQGVARRPDGTYRGYKVLTCPYCHERTKATIVRKVEPSGRSKPRSPGSDAQLLR
jgi:hypothetical protein